MRRKQLFLLMFLSLHRMVELTCCLYLERAGACHWSQSTEYWQSLSHYRTLFVFLQTLLHCI